MNVTDILADKRVKSVQIKDTFGLLKKHKPLGLIMLSDREASQGLIEGLQVIEGCFIVVNSQLEETVIHHKIAVTHGIDDVLLSGFDFIVCDDEIAGLTEYAAKGITPIMVRNNHLGSLLKEFNPLKNEGNSFFYDEVNSWSIFYTIVRYLENYKFPFDNKNLVKNVLSL